MDEESVPVARIRYRDEGFGQVFSVRRPVLWYSCVERRQDHDLRWRYSSETGWQSRRRDRRQRWQRRPGPRCRNGSRIGVLTKPAKATLVQRETCSTSSPSSQLVLFSEFATALTQ